MKKICRFGDLEHDEHRDSPLSITLIRSVARCRSDKSQNNSQLAV